jgi:phytoene dehydrogenase-like protein
MFALRPAAGFSKYRGPVPGLYLTGASTHPGGGIMGAAGRNAAAALLHDLTRNRVW